MSDLLFHLKLLLKLILQNREYFKMSEIRQSFKLEKVKNEDRHRLIYMSNLLLHLKLLLKLILQKREYFKMSEIRQS